MEIVLWGLLGVLLAFLLVKYGPRALKGKDGEQDDIKANRIGDGLKRLNENKKKYGQMEAGLLAQTPDEDLIEAVLSNLWAKMKPDMSDALGVISQQSKGRQYIFAVYAVTGGVKQVGFEKLKTGPDAVLLPTALEALQAMEMPQSAELLEKATQADEADEYREPYREAFAAEDGKERMMQYIREHETEFVD